MKKENFSDILSNIFWGLLSLFFISIFFMFSWGLFDELKMKIKMNELEYKKELMKMDKLD